MKKFFIGAVAFIMATQGAFAGYFVDFEKNSLNYFYETGVFTGYPDGTFRPEGFLNRAELLKIVMEASGHRVTVPREQCFFDVAVEEWHAPYVCTAKDLGYIVGYDGGSVFRPGEFVNKVEAIKMIAEVMDWELIEFRETDHPKYVEIFEDVSQEDDWFANYVNNAVYFGYIEGNNDRELDPGDSINREDASEILFRTMMLKKTHHNTFNTHSTEEPNAYNLGLIGRNFFRIYEEMKSLNRSALDIKSYGGDDYGAVVKQPDDLEFYQKTNATSFPELYLFVQKFGGGANEYTEADFINFGYEPNCSPGSCHEEWEFASVDSDGYHLRGSLFYSGTDAARIREVVVPFDLEKPWDEEEICDSENDCEGR